jgi:glycosyltransferase involved in cell wall biosynthesis
VKIVFVTCSLVHGGAERQTITLANRLAERGHQYHLAYVKDDRSQLSRVRGAAGVHGLNAARYLDRRAVAELTMLIEELQPSHVIGVNQYGLFYAWMAHRLASSPASLGVTFHTTELRTLKEQLQMVYYRPLFWSADWLVFVCEAQRRYWNRRLLHGRRTDVIYNGIDVDYWRPLPDDTRAHVRHALGFGALDFVTGISAVLRPEKNHVQLIEALAALRSQGVPAKALLIGDGPTRPAVEARARALGVAEHVVISGLQQDVRPLVGACDAIALCSTSVETFSLAALEAMALARPVVQSQIGGAAEMTQPGHDGFLYPVGDTPALVDRLARLADPAAAQRMGRNARESVEQRFSEKAMVDQYEQALMELDGTRSRRGNVRKAAGAY